MVMNAQTSRTYPASPGHLADRIELRQDKLQDPVFVGKALGDANFIDHLAGQAQGVGYDQGRHLSILRHNDSPAGDVGATPPRMISEAGSVEPTLDKPEGRFTRSADMTWLCCALTIQ